MPCCYHLGRDTLYTPFTPDLTLKLSRETLRLAVNETVTAQGYEIKQRNQDMAWKLGFQQLRQKLSGHVDYHPFNPVQKSWLKDSFQSYCQKLCQREQLTLLDRLDWNALKNRGLQRQQEVMRLQLLRQSFKRALELWLIMDMAVYLESCAYHVDVHTFCERAVTPRNIVIEGYGPDHKPG